VKTFLVKAKPEEMWRFNPDLDRAIIAGFKIKAFTPEGAAQKACNRGLIKVGLKNCVVDLDGERVANLYPMKYPPMMFFDTPLDYLLGVTR
jgi:hypothetical protein